MSETERPLEIDVLSVASMLEQNQRFAFIDCREANEYETAKIDGAVLLPMSEIGERVAEIEDQKPELVIVHCHHGGRSLRVAKWLRSQGFHHAQSMAGGIDAWSLQIDNSIPRY